MPIEDSKAMTTRERRQATGGMMCLVPAKTEADKMRAIRANRWSPLVVSATKL